MATLTVKFPRPLDVSSIQMIARLVAVPSRPLEHCVPPIDVDIYDLASSPDQSFPDVIKDPDPRTTWESRLADETDGPRFRELLASERGYFVIGATSIVRGGKQYVKTLEYAEVVRKGDSYELECDSPEGDNDLPRRPPPLQNPRRKQRPAVVKAFMDGLNNVLFNVSVVYHAARAMHSPETVNSRIRDIRPPGKIMLAISSTIRKVLGWWSS